MLVPAYWSEATVVGEVDGDRTKVKRFGWSDVDESAARRMAEERARDALARLQRGEDMPESEPKVPYNGAEGVPIREEIVRRAGDTVITRNSYGALCLNTPDVFFADIDFDVSRVSGTSCLISLGVGIALSVVGFAESGPRGAFIGFVAGVVAATLVLAALGRAWSHLRGGPVRAAERRVARVAARNPNGRFEVYRTPAGLRVLAAHDVFDPAGDAARALFAALGADPVYVTMCRRQRCFRARLSAKPWRIGVTGHMKPRPGVWPVDPTRRAERAAWLADYDRAAAAFAACRHVQTLGLGAEHPRVAPVRRLHDEWSRSRTTLPIA